MPAQFRARTRVLLTTGFLALALVGCQSPSGTAGGDAQASAATGDAEKQELVCRYEQPTGSLFKKRVCRTREQMEAEREGARRAMDAIDNPGAQGGSPSG